MLLLFSLFWSELCEKPTLSKVTNTLSGVTQLKDLNHSIKSVPCYRTYIHPIRMKPYSKDLYKWLLGQPLLKGFWLIQWLESNNSIDIKNIQLTLQISYPIPYTYDGLLTMNLYHLHHWSAQKSLQAITTLLLQPFLLI